MTVYDFLYVFNDDYEVVRIYDTRTEEEVFVGTIRDAYRDEDGYWICLKEGWEASRTDSGCRTIHEDTIPDLRYQIAGIQRIA